MGKVYELYVLEGLKDIEAEEFPFSIWLPYVRLESERFRCKETGEVWHRFEGVTIYSEDDDYPEGDLIEEGEKTPEGLVCWQGKKGTVPEAGDVFRVLDGNNQVVFEEVISGNVSLYGREYMSAEKKAEFGINMVRNLEREIKSVLVAGDDGYSVYSRLKDISTGSSHSQVRLPVSFRGLNFEVAFDEYEVNTGVTLNFYHYDGESLVRSERTLSPSDKWYQVRIYAAGDEKDFISACWGLGNVSDAVVKVQGILDKSSLDSRIADAIVRSNAAQGPGLVSLDNEVIR